MDVPRTPSLRLDGRRALVTGASRGIGFAAAAALAQAGAHVVLTARAGDELREATRRLADEGASTESFACDVADVRRFGAAIGSMQAFDVFVNNAGTNLPARFLDVTINDYDHVMDLNLRAAFFASQAVARGMARAGMRGSIIHVSSQMGHVGGKMRTVYCTSKFAIEGLTKAMALELAPNGIRVNAIAPTFVETTMIRAFMEDDEFRRYVQGKIKLGRLGRVEDLMGAILLLASDASALMTGASLLIDGGWTAD